MGAESNFDIVCLSQFAWNYIWTRPQHLMLSAAQEHRVFYVQPPLYGTEEISLSIESTDSGVNVVSLVINEHAGHHDEVIGGLVSQLFREHVSKNFVLVYYTPRAIPWTRELKPLVTVYECMETIDLNDSSSDVAAFERELLSEADMVFTSGQSLYEAMFSKNPHVYSIPSRVDVKDFVKARQDLTDPADQVQIPHPRLGFFGIIDHRLDFELLSKVALTRQDWHIILVGPIEIEQEKLPRAENIHYLGFKDYSELPNYISGWDVAIIPFADNEATQFLNPTKTSEYLAAGTPVVSTPIADVVRPYSLHRMVRIADSADAFIASCQRCLESGSPVDQDTIDRFLHNQSWSETWTKMRELIDESAKLKRTGENDAGLENDFREIGSRLGSNP